MEQVSPDDGRPRVLQGTEESEVQSEVPGPEANFIFAAIAPCSAKISAARSRQPFIPASFATGKMPVVPVGAANELMVYYRHGLHKRDLWPPEVSFEMMTLPTFLARYGVGGGASLRRNTEYAFCAARYGTALVESSSSATQASKAATLPLERNATAPSGCVPKPRYARICM